MPRPTKIRLDQAVVDRGLAPDCDAAQRGILAGNVNVNGQREDKPGTLVREDAVITVAGGGPGYASRGGEKLARAIDVFGVDLSGAVAVDVGASTGGFTDVLLRQGASRVYCVDVGYGQLAWELRQDPRVVVFDRTNARNLAPGMFDPSPSFATVDVSFISISKILPALARVLTPQARAVCLVKPQFEAERNSVGKRGVVESEETHAQVLCDAYMHARSAGFSVAGLAWSPITGPAGNIEFLMYIWRGDGLSLPQIRREDLQRNVAEVVADAHRALGRRRRGDCHEEGRDRSPNDET